MKILDELKEKLNTIDQKMIDLYFKRLDLIKDIIAYKNNKESNLMHFDVSLETNSKYDERFNNTEYELYYKNFIQHLDNSTKLVENAYLNNGIIGYYGAPGTFTHLALKSQFKDHATKDYKTFEECFEALEHCLVDAIVLPIENSYTGEVGEVIDLLYKYNLYISKMFTLKIEHHLLGLKGSTLSQIKTVYSHPQILRQCEEYLSKQDWIEVPFASSAVCAKHIIETNSIDHAVIASKETAELYDLDILEQYINVANDNRTKFIVIEKQMNKTSSRFSIIFTVDHTFGQLAELLQLIASYKFNLENIKSRPNKRVSWGYYFYAEVIGSIDEDNAKELIQILEQKCEYFKVVGAYTIK